MAENFAVGAADASRALRHGSTASSGFGERFAASFIAIGVEDVRDLAMLKDGEAVRGARRRARARGREARANPSGAASARVRRRSSRSADRGRGEDDRGRARRGRGRERPDALAARAQAASVRRLCRCDREHGENALQSGAGARSRRAAIARDRAGHGAFGRPRGRAKPPPARGPQRRAARRGRPRNRSGPARVRSPAAADDVHGVRVSALKQHLLGQCDPATRPARRTRTAGQVRIGSRSTSCSTSTPLSRSSRWSAGGGTTG